MNRLITKHYEELQSIAKRICGKELYEDILHDTVLRTLEIGKELPDRDELIKYFRVAIKNRLLDHHKTNHTVNVDPNTGFLHGSTQMEDEFYQKVVDGDIMELLEAEFGNDARLFEMYYYNDLTLRDIANTTRTPQATVAWKVRKISDWLIRHIGN